MFVITIITITFLYIMVDMTMSVTMRVAIAIPFFHYLIPKIPSRQSGSKWYRRDQANTSDYYSYYLRRDYLLV